jgi:peroxin-10
MLLLLPLISRTIASWQERQSRLEEEAKKSQALRETERGRPSTSVKPVTSRFQIDGKPVDLDSIEPARHIEENSLEVIENEKENLTPYSILPRSDLVNPDRQCPLCLSPCGLSEESGGTCVTECGHVFCWSCIEDWGAEKVSLSLNDVDRR